MPYRSFGPAGRAPRYLGSLLTCRDFLTGRLHRQPLPPSPPIHGEKSLSCSSVCSTKHLTHFARHLTHPLPHSECQRNLVDRISLCTNNNSIQRKRLMLTHQTGLPLRCRIGQARASALHAACSPCTTSV